MLKQPLFFIGIGGSGMTPLAVLAKSRGYACFGYDKQESYNTKLLKKAGIQIDDGRGEKINIAGARVVVSSAISNENPYYQQAKELGLSFAHRSDLLNELLSQTTNSLCVSGSHGKTTTSAIMTFLLESLGKNPSAVVGGQMHNYQNSALTGGLEYMVAEADESDGTFLKYRPFAAILTNADLDHLDFYKDKKTLFLAFSEYLENVAKEGFVIINARDRHLVSPKVKARVISYSSRDVDCDLSAQNIQIKNRNITFDVKVNLGKGLANIYPVSLPLIGIHNVENALAALSAVYGFGLDLKEACLALRGFLGVKRRMDFILKSEDLCLIDDYAHNPGKIAAAISGLKASYPEFKLNVVLQPHRFSRVTTLYEEFCHSLKGVDLCVVLPVYAAGEIDTGGFDVGRFCSDIAAASVCPVHYANDFDEAIVLLERQPKKVRLVLSVGAGNITDFCPYYMKKIQTIS